MQPAAPKTLGSSTNAMQMDENTSWAEGNSRWAGTDRTQQKEQCALYYYDRYNTYLLMKQLDGNIVCSLYV